MAFTVTDLQEVLHLLGEQPQLRAQFRTLLVTDSLQVLPEQVARLSTAVEQLAEAQGRTEQRLERLAEAQERTEEQVRALAQAQQRTEARLERLEATVQSLAEAQERTEEQVRALAQAQQRTEARLERLEATVQSLAEAQQRTEERLEQLAEAQQRTEERLEQLAEAQQRTEERLEQLAEAQRRTEARLEELATDVRALTGEVHRLADWQRGEAGRREGERYERTMVQQAIVWFSGGQGDPPVRPAMRQHLNQILQNLDNLGALREEQNPLLADLIWWKDEHYAVVEISRYVNGHDVTRAARRAATLEAAGVQAIGIVIGQHWGTADTRDQAIDEAVQWRVGDDLSAGYLAFCRRPA